ncbi:hypothetical protein BAUCODRAFT_446274 [Baudoinia panamericana UAMH 10762]|uniref:Uncharacterized protein n=1 Tax=Baudoinia panamericana (strain UAMH 10762) TaxID=717646 RepID=M2NEB1_BAUPA|nr:uncharacterized protein BAUCODRAFT_446274 [Baudoinia panamericana UAMH 10762]EMC97295.1 hypothetical protein BAUCODRAFT_446274 [Baudoinia panamericana UAMH 10762]
MLIFPFRYRASAFLRHGQGHRHRLRTSMAQAKNRHDLGEQNLDRRLRTIRRTPPSTPSMEHIQGNGSIADQSSAMEGSSTWAHNASNYSLADVEHPVTFSHAGADTENVQPDYSATCASAIALQAATGYHQAAQYVQR